MADYEVPLQSSSPYSCDSLPTSVGDCSICSNRRRRSKLIWACVLLWAVPAALASTRAANWWGRSRQPAIRQPKGTLLMVQVRMPQPFCQESTQVGP